MVHSRSIRMSKTFRVAIQARTRFYYVLGCHLLRTYGNLDFFNSPTTAVYAARRMPVTENFVRDRWFELPRIRKREPRNTW